MTGRARRYPIDGTVEVAGPVEVSFLSAIPTAPAAWHATAWLRFRVGEVVFTRRFTTSWTYAADQEISDAELVAGRESAVDGLRREMARIGFTPLHLRVEEKVPT
jgi:hypothetical protein